MEQERQPADQGFWRELWDVLCHVVLKLGLVLLFAVAGTVVVFLLPVIAPLIVLSERLHQRRKRAVASRTACVRCGRILGPAAVDRGDEVWTAEMRARFDAHPGLRLVRARIVRTLYAVCLACGARYSYDEKTRMFHPAPDTLPEASGPVIDGIP